MFVLASNHFRKCFSVNAGVWLRMENKFSKKYFQLTVCFNGFDPEIGFSQNFHFKSFSDSHAKRERERERRESPYHAFDFTGKPRAQIMPRTHSPDHAFDFVELRTDLRTHEPIFDPEPLTHKPSTSPTTQSLCATNPRIDLCVCMILIFCVILIDPRTDLYFCVILIFYFLSLISNFFVVGVVVWVVVFWWFSCCVVVGFVWVVVENSIFRTLLNT